MTQAAMSPGSRRTTDRVPVVVSLGLVLAATVLGCTSDASIMPVPTSLPDDTRRLDTAFASADPARRTGTIEPAALREVSGIAVSTLDPGRLWMHADSGAAAVIYAIDRRGRRLARYRIATEAHDWEDIAAVRVDGVSWLLIGDIGDNLGRRDAVTILAVREPMPSADPARPLVPIRMRFRYPDGAVDAEALASDGERLWILTKRPWSGSGRTPSRLWSLPMPWTVRADALVTARAEATLGMPPTDAETRLVGALTGVDIGQPTAFTITADASVAFTLSYRHVRRYRRATSESWATALARRGERLYVHDLRQAEALDVDPDGVLWFASEGAPPPLWALPTTGRSGSRR